MRRNEKNCEKVKEEELVCSGEGGGGGPDVRRHRAGGRVGGQGAACAPWSCASAKLVATVSPEFRTALLTGVFTRTGGQGERQGHLLLPNGSVS